jgi:hypothetical protein
VKPVTGIGQVTHRSLMVMMMTVVVGMRMRVPMLVAMGHCQPMVVMIHRRQPVQTLP